MFSHSMARYIRRGKPDAGFALFESESLKWPGFVEFDDVNGKVLTYSAQDRYFLVLMMFCYLIVECILLLRAFFFLFFFASECTRCLTLKTILCFTLYQTNTSRKLRSGNHLSLYITYICLCK